MTIRSSGPMQGDGSRYRCGHCKQRLDGYSHKDAEVYPSPGDIGICAYCGTAQEYVEGGVVPLSEARRRALPRDLQDQLARGAEAVKARNARAFPPAYYQQIEAMAAAAKAWVVAHPDGCLQLNQINPDDLPISPADRAKVKALIASEGYDKMALIADLALIAPHWAGNEATLQLLRHLDEVSGMQATHMQTKIALELAFQVELDATAPTGAS